MLKYGDYFSRKTLYQCGISPDAALAIKGEAAYLGSSRKQLISADMKGIYQSFATALAGKGGNSIGNEIKRLGIENRIVNAFYDSGVLDAGERDYFKSNPSLFAEAGAERERISVGEATERISSAPTTSKVAQQIKPAEVSNVRK